MSVAATVFSAQDWSSVQASHRHLLRRVSGDYQGALGGRRLVRPPCLFGGWARREKFQDIDLAEIRTVWRRSYTVKMWERSIGHPKEYAKALLGIVLCLSFLHSTVHFIMV